MLSLPLAGQCLLVDLEGRVEVFQGLDPDLQQEVLELYFGEDGIGVLPPMPALGSLRASIPQGQTLRALGRERERT